MIKRKQRSLVIFFLIYLTFTALIVLLVVFTPGLEFKEENGKVYLKNQSVHIVTNVKVELADGTPINCIQKLKPHSIERLYVPKKRRPTKIIALAPFHQKVEKTLLPLGEKGFRLEHSIEYTKPVLLSQEFELKLKLCAENADLGTILIKAQHKESFFKEERQNRIITLQKGECRTQTYWFTPLKKGSTIISFKIEGENYGSTIEETIRVE